MCTVLTEDNKAITDNNDEVTIDIDDENIDKIMKQKI